MKNYINIIFSATVELKTTFLNFIDVNFRAWRVINFTRTGNLRYAIEIAIQDIEASNPRFSFSSLVYILESDEDRLKDIEYGITYTPMLDDESLIKIREKMATKDDPMNELLDILRPIADSIRRKSES